MSDKKIIVFAVVLSIALGAGGWYYAKNRPSNPGPAAIAETPQDNSEKTPPLVYGNENAPVIIEEYTNFLCPACGQFAVETMPKIEENFIKTGKAKMVFYIYPPLELGRVAFCSDKQGKFVEYHNYLFAHQSEITKEEDLFDFAEVVGLDKAQLIECFNTDAANQASKDWYENGQGRQVDATPTFFINGEKLIGAQAYEEFERVINSKLSE
ncbi:MAG: thioredoxin domain-containing protein [Candidatus Portnoybacteria bacterium]|nr:thioredoxin domain-containing protein [Candidatus Portnoybacteria bacterium]